MRSDGHAGTWLAPVTVYESHDTSRAHERVIDPSARITILIRRIGSNEYAADIVRYLPGLGWQTPEVAYSTPDFFQRVDSATNADGYLIVTTELQGCSAVIYDPTVGTWSELTPLAPPGSSVRPPGLIHSRNGSSVYALYHVYDAAPKFTTVGIRAHRFDPVTGTFEPSVRLPGSFSALTDLNNPPLGVVDDGGTATVTYFTYQQLRRTFHLRANQRVDGVWNRAARLRRSRDLPSFEPFGDVATNVSGDVLVVYTHYAHGVNNLWAHRFDAAAGVWRAGETPYTDDNALQTRARVAFHSNDAAVATFLENQNGTTQLTSILYDGANWGPQLLDVPRQDWSFFHETATDDGEVVMWFEGEFGPFGPDVGTFVTWLR